MQQLQEQLADIDKGGGSPNTKKSSQIPPRSLARMRHFRGADRLFLSFLNDRLGRG